MNSKVIFRNGDLDKYSINERKNTSNLENKTNRSVSEARGRKKVETRQSLQYSDNEINNNNKSSISLNISKKFDDEVSPNLNKSGSLNYSRYRDSFTGNIATINKPEISDLSISVINNSPVLKQNSSRYKRFTNQFQGSLY